MENPKLKHQLTKAVKMADCLQRTFKATAKQAEKMTDENWNQLAAVAGVNPPSEDSRMITLEFLRDRERRRKG